MCNGLCCGIKFETDGELSLDTYSDADFANDVKTRRSTTGYYIMFSGGPVSWNSRKQPVVAMFTTGEYISAADYSRELLYLKTLIEELLNREIPANLFVDNQSAIHLVKNVIVNKRSNHIDVRFQFINEKVSEGLINIKYCPTQEQLADILTKSLSFVKFDKFKKCLIF